LKKKKREIDDKHHPIHESNTSVKPQSDTRTEDIKGEQYYKYGKGDEKHVGS